MDHIGAIVGPLIATVFLFFLPGRYRLLFLLTAIPGALAVASLFKVEEPEPLPLAAERAAISDVGTGATTATVVRDRAKLPARLYAVLAIILLFSIGNSADAFLLLRLTDTIGSGTYIPLLWAALHVVKASLSTWGGTLSDRIGRRRVIVLGWIVYAVVYLGFAIASSAGALISWFLFYGVYFALTEGSGKALIADLTPAGAQATAFGFHDAALGAGALLASVMFGVIYDHFGAPAAFGLGAALAAVAALLLTFVDLRPVTPA